MFATEHERKRGTRPGLVVTDVASVMYGCQVGAMLSCHVSRVTRLSRSSWRDCRHQTEICTAVTSPSLQQRQIIRKWENDTMLEGGKWHESEHDDSFTFHWLFQLDSLYVLMSPCYADCIKYRRHCWAIFSLIHVSLMSDVTTGHMLQRCRLQTRIKTR